jgi:hypothetical protein
MVSEGLKDQRRNVMLREVVLEGEAVRLTNVNKVLKVALIGLLASGGE